MPKDSLRERGRALEEAFFNRENEALLERLRGEKAKETTRDQLARASGLTDSALLDRLLELGVDAETLAALSLAPLVSVAWADGKLDAPERKAILDAADGRGIRQGSPTFELLQGWLATRPGPELQSAWMDYARVVLEELGEVRQGLERDVLGLARGVAEAAGGLLGFGNKVSDAEARVLAELETAFR